MVLTASSFFGITPVWSQDLVVYPAKGQSNDQMEKDKFECYSWAKGQTGFDPMAMPHRYGGDRGRLQGANGGSTAFTVLMTKPCSTRSLFTCII